MTFSNMAFLSTWADWGRRYGARDPADGTVTVTVIRDYIRAFFDEFLLGEDSRLLHIEHADSPIAKLRSTKESR
jgi:hypothetical protein